jgi:hypothetical protein
LCRVVFNGLSVGPGKGFWTERQIRTFESCYSLPKRFGPDGKARTVYQSRRISSEGVTDGQRNRREIGQTGSDCASFLMGVMHGRYGLNYAIEGSELHPSHLPRTRGGVQFFRPTNNQ